MHWLLSQPCCSTEVLTIEQHSTLLEQQIRRSQTTLFLQPVAHHITPPPPLPEHNAYASVLLSLGAPLAWLGEKAEAEAMPECENRYWKASPETLLSGQRRTQRLTAKGPRRP